MNLEDILQSKNGKDCMISLIEVPRVVTITENRMVIGSSWGVKNGQLLFNGYRVSVL